MKRFKLFILFIIINFGSLAVGSFLMNNGPRTDWYINLNKAPWTPPGWVFGVTWSLIMLCFSIYLAELFAKLNQKKVRIAYGIQIILNIGWNYFFFNKHNVLFGFLILLMLNVVLYFFFFSLKHNLEKTRLLILPYLIWMGIATSLNLYIIIHN